MNETIARAARLLQNPDLIKALPKALTDPQALGRLAGIGEDNLKLLSGIGNTVTGLLKNFTKTAANRGASVQLAPTPRSVGTRPRSGSPKGTAIAGTVSLAAITGAVVVVGTVSAVALAKGRKATET
jgi:hypothetical protein